MSAFANLIRVNVVCPQCKFHTLQIYKPRGWQCKECSSFVEIFEQKEKKNGKTIEHNTNI